MDSTSQTSRLLKVLKANKKHGVANYRFPQMGILRYSARLADLRKEGYSIVAERVYANGRWTGVWNYRLIEEDDYTEKPSLISRLKAKVHV